MRINPKKPAYAACTWRMAPEQFQMEPDGVDVWIADLDSGFARLDAYAALLSDRELRRVERLKVAEVAQRYVVSRGILRLLLARYTGQDVADLAFQFGELGKPSLRPLASGETLSFNNTDSREMAIYAFAWDRELGVDLERLPRKVRSERIARRRFSKAEAETLGRLDGEERDSAFLACWTRKEAWGKATGKGIRYSMRDIDLCSCMEKPVMQPDPAQALATGADSGVKTWRLVQLRPDENALASVVAAGDNWRINAWRYTHRQLDMQLSNLT